MGNDATYWASPHLQNRELPDQVIPPDGLMPVLLEAGAEPGAEAVRVERVWPANLWPTRNRPLDLPTA